MTCSARAAASAITGVLQGDTRNAYLTKYVRETVKKEGILGLLLGVPFSTAVTKEEEASSEIATTPGTTQQPGSTPKPTPQPSQQQRPTSSEDKLNVETIQSQALL